jgi:PadR family transcriptional regulator, regulatory protein PadR
MEQYNLGAFEELVLLALQHLDGEDYGVPVRQALEAATKRPVAIGAVTTTMERLEKKGYVSSRLGDPTPERGGRAKRYYKLEATGERALAAAAAARRQLRPALGSDHGGGL